MTKVEAWEACKSKLPGRNWSISDESTYRVFFSFGYEAGAEQWKDAARLLGEELKKYKPEAPHG